VNYSVYYYIQGPGVTLPPKGLFSVVRDTGMVQVHGPIDREQYPKLVVSTHTCPALQYTIKTGNEFW